MEKTKKTQKEMYEMIKEVCADNVEIVDFCNLKIEQLAKKNANSTTKVQKENIEVVDMLIQELEKIGKPVTITDLMNTSEVVKAYRLENGNPLSNQKISSLLNRTDNDKVVKIPDKKKTYFTIKSE